MVLRITDWQKHFENNRTRELQNLTWVPIPNKQDGDGYTELLDHPHGAAHFGAWIAIVEVASKCDPRGTLLREGAKPHDSASLSRITRISKGVFDEAIPRLISIGWLTSELVASSTLTSIPQEGATIPQASAALLEGNGREGKEINTCTEPPVAHVPAVLSFPVTHKAGEPSQWSFTESHAADLSSTFPALDVLAESRKALGWVKANPGRRKTSRGMAKFLFGWMERAQNRGSGSRRFPDGGGGADEHSGENGFQRAPVTRELIDLATGGGGE